TDPQTLGVVYAATSGGGVFRSGDGARAWASLNVGLTNSDVRSLAVSPSGACLHAGTFGTGEFAFATAIEPCTGLIPTVPAPGPPSSPPVQVGTTATPVSLVVNPRPHPPKSRGIAPPTNVPAHL